MLAPFLFLTAHICDSVIITSSYTHICTHITRGGGEAHTEKKLALVKR